MPRTALAKNRGCDLLSHLRSSQCHIDSTLTELVTFGDPGTVPTVCVWDSVGRLSRKFRLILHGVLLTLSRIACIFNKN